MGGVCTSLKAIEVEHAHTFSAQIKQHRHAEKLQRQKAAAEAKANAEQAKAKRRAKKLREQEMASQDLAGREENCVEDHFAYECGAIRAGGSCPGDEYAEASLPEGETFSARTASASQGASSKSSLSKCSTADSLRSTRTTPRRNLAAEKVCGGSERAVRRYRDIGPETREGRPPGARRAERLRDEGGRALSNAFSALQRLDDSDVE